MSETRCIICQRPRVLVVWHISVGQETKGPYCMACSEKQIVTEKKKEK